MPSRSERKVWRSLRQRKGRDATGWFLAEGPRLLEELLAAGGAIHVILHEPASGRGAAVRDLLERGERAGLRIEEVERHVIEEIADTKTPQAVVTVADIPRWTWDDVASGPIVLLDGVQDPGNVGTLARTGVALGAAAVIALETTADPWGPKAVRAAAGAGVRRPVFRADRASTMDELERREMPLWVAAADGDPIGRVGAPQRRVAVALGSETRGVSPELDAAATRRVAISMRGGAESLNVAAAGAILLDRIIGMG